MERLTDELTFLFGTCRDAVVAVRDGAVAYYNGAAAGLIPDIGFMKPASFLPGPALDGTQMEYRGEADVSGCRMSVAAATVRDCRIVLLSPSADRRPETAEILTAAGVELKNVLAVLKMASELLLPTVENLGNPRLNRYTAILYHCFYSMLRLTNNLVDLGAILRGGRCSRPDYL